MSNAFQKPHAGPATSTFTELAGASGYDRIGGAPAVTTAVDRFSTRLLADPRLAHFFTGVELLRLKRHGSCCLEWGLS